MSDNETVLREALVTIALGQCPPDVNHAPTIGDMWWQRVARRALSLTRPEPVPSTSDATPMQGRGAEPKEKEPSR